MLGRLLERLRRKPSPERLEQRQKELQALAEAEKNRASSPGINPGSY